MDIRGLVETMVQDAAFNRVINNPLAGFGTPERHYLGAELLPEVNVPENAFTEEAIKYRTVVANNGTRYSPVQKKGGVLTGSFTVELADSDIGSEFTGRDYDGLIRLLERFTGSQGFPGGGVNRPDMQAMVKLTQWVDMSLNRPLIERNEVMRWQAIVNAQITLTGDNGFFEQVKIPNPTGSRVNAAGTWSSNGYDPWTDIITGAEYLAGKGYKVNRIIASTPVRTKLSNNTNVKTRAGHISYTLGGGLTPVIAGRVPLERINELLSQDGLPPIELYDLLYRTQNGQFRFFPNNCVVLVATTDRDQEIDLGDFQNLFEMGQGNNPVTMHNTIGYCAIGRAAGQNVPGRRTHIEAFDNKPPRVEGEAWQTSLPVITEPEALYVIQNIT